MEYYKIEIHQYRPQPYGLHTCFEIYDTLETMVRAFNEMNSEKMFGPVEKQSITPDWQTDPFSWVQRRNGDTETRITASCCRARTTDYLRQNGAFSADRNPDWGCLKTF